MIKNKTMARKKVKDIKKLTDVVINNDEVIGKVTDIISREELEKSDTSIKIEFICVSVNLGSKGAKTANFYQNKEMGYNRNKPLTLFFDSDEECKFEAGKKYNFTISEV